MASLNHFPTKILHELRTHMPVSELLRYAEGKPYSLTSFRHGKERVSFLTIKGKANADRITALIAEHYRPWVPVTEENAKLLRAHRKALKSRRAAAK